MFSTPSAIKFSGETGAPLIPTRCSRSYTLHTLDLGTTTESFIFEQMLFKITQDSLLWKSSSRNYSSMIVNCLFLFVIVDFFSTPFNRFNRETHDSWTPTTVNAYSHLILLLNWETQNRIQHLNWDVTDRISHRQWERVQYLLWISVVNFRDSVLIRFWFWILTVVAFTIMHSSS